VDLGPAGRPRPRRPGSRVVGRLARDGALDRRSHRKVLEGATRDSLLAAIHGPNGVPEIVEPERTPLRDRGFDSGCRLRFRRGQIPSFGTRPGSRHRGMNSGIFSAEPASCSPSATWRSRRSNGSSESARGSPRGTRGGSGASGVRPRDGRPAPARRAAARRGARTPPRDRSPARGGFPSRTRCGRPACPT
jgi:hypothetical protein